MTVTEAIAEVRRLIGESSAGYNLDADLQARVIEADQTIQSELWKYLADQMGSLESWTYPKDADYLDLTSTPPGGVVTGRVWAFSRIGYTEQSGAVSPSNPLIPMDSAPIDDVWADNGLILSDDVEIYDYAGTMRSGSSKASRLLSLLSAAMDSGNLYIRPWAGQALYLKMKLLRLRDTANYAGGTAVLGGKLQQFVRLVPIEAAIWVGIRDNTTRQVLLAEKARLMELAMREGSSGQGARQYVR